MQLVFILANIAIEPSDLNIFTNSNALFSRETSSFLFYFVSRFFFGSADFIPGRSDDRRNRSADFAASAVVGAAAAAAADVGADVATADVAPSYRHKNFTTQHV